METTVRRASRQFEPLVKLGTRPVGQISYPLDRLETGKGRLKSSARDHLQTPSFGAARQRREGRRARRIFQRSRSWPLAEGAHISYELDQVDRTNVDGEFSDRHASHANRRRLCSHSLFSDPERQTPP